MRSKTLRCTQPSVFFLLCFALVLFFCNHEIFFWLLEMTGKREELEDRREWRDRSEIEKRRKKALNEDMTILITRQTSSTKAKFVVLSQTSSFYLVEIPSLKCTCMDAKFYLPCKHVLFVLATLDLDLDKYRRDIPEEFVVTVPVSRIEFPIEVWQEVLAFVD
jgi:hypothetical protein